MNPPTLTFEALATARMDALHAAIAALEAWRQAHEDSHDRHEERAGRVDSAREQETRQLRDRLQERDHEIGRLEDRLRQLDGKRW